MIPWEVLECVPVRGGGEISLHRRGTEYSIRAGGQDLMNSRRHDSEEALAHRGCAQLASVRGARVLVGGLGMGFTVRASLDRLGPTARVDVVDLVPAVVRWNRGPLAHLAGRPLEDARVRVVEADVADVLASSPGTYDAILMDVDNGPRALTASANSRLYTPAGLAAAAQALRPHGTYAVWSPAESPWFTESLRRAGFDVRTEKVPARRGSGGRHVLWIARIGRPTPRT
jgi:spermidine synthase